MRVLQAVHALPPATYGGTELYTRDLAAALGERGHEVAVAAPRGADETEVQGVETFELPDPGGETAPAVGERSVSAVRRGRTADRFREVLAAFDPDVVHFQHVKHLSADLPRLCAERGVAGVATLHDFWTICHREQLYRPEGRPCSGPESVEKCAACLRRAREQRGAATETAAGAEIGVDAEPTTDGGTAACGGPAVDAVAERDAQLRRTLAALDRLVAPSRFLGETFAEFGAPAERLVHLRNGIRVDRFDGGAFDPDGPLRVGYAGRVTETKGVHLLVEAARRVDGVSLDVFGEFDSESDDYHARLAEAAGERTTFRGWYEERPEPYREVDVLVLPSLWYENSPLVIQEAFASGVPVVTGDAGGMAELVTDGEDGLTFPPGDADALADRLRRLARNPDLVADLREGVDAPKRLADHAEEVSALYGDAVERRGEVS